MRVGNNTSHTRQTDFSEGIEVCLACSLFLKSAFSAFENDLAGDDLANVAESDHQHQSHQCCQPGQMDIPLILGVNFSLKQGKQHPVEQQEKYPAASHSRFWMAAPTLADWLPT